MNLITFSKMIDGKVKRISSTGAGAKRGKAEVITPEEEEEKLWITATLGDHSPKSLLNTIFYMCGIYFTQQSGQEHHQLRHKPCQIELIEKPRERDHIFYM